MENRRSGGQFRSAGVELKLPRIEVGAAVGHVALVVAAGAEVDDAFRPSGFAVDDVPAGIGIDFAAPGDCRATARVEVRAVVCGAVAVTTIAGVHVPAGPSGLAPVNVH